MSTNYKIQKLSKELSMLGFQKESADVAGLLGTNSSQDWQAVLDEIIKEEAGGVAEVMDMIFPPLKEAAKVGQKILKYNPKDIEAAIKMATEVPGIKSVGSLMELDDSTLLKISKLKDINNTNYKTAESSSMVWRLVQKFGKGALRLLPIIGFIASFAFWFKNFIYGTAELISLLSGDDVDQLNLSCGKFNPRLCALDPGALAECFKQNKDDPKKLKILASITKKSKYFADEAISFGINFIDFVKDVLFIVPSFLAFLGAPASGGVSWGIVSLDVGLSLILMLVEYSAESVMLSWWDQILNDIKTTAEKNIARPSESTPIPEGMIHKKYTPEELEEWWAQQKKAI